MIIPFISQLGQNFIEERPLFFLSHWWVNEKNAIREIQYEIIQVIKNLVPGRRQLCHPIIQ
jgi:hypothetical protein